MNPKLKKKIDYLYRTCKQMPLLCVLSLFVPIVLPFVVPLCIVYASQRSSLLKELHGIDLTPSEDTPGAQLNTTEQIAYLRKNGIRFYFPIIIAVAVAVILIGFIALG